MLLFVIELFLKIHGKPVSTLSSTVAMVRWVRRPASLEVPWGLKGNEHLIMSAECQSCQTGAPPNRSGSALTILLLWLSLTEQ